LDEGFGGRSIEYTTLNITIQGSVS
jgi:hypothetical protein